MHSHCPIATTASSAASTNRRRRHHSAASSCHPRRPHGPRSKASRPPLLGHPTTSTSSLAAAHPSHPPSPVRSGQIWRSSPPPSQPLPLSLSTQPLAAPPSSPPHHPSLTSRQIERPLPTFLPDPARLIQIWRMTFVLLPSPPSLSLQPPPSPPFSFLSHQIGPDLAAVFNSFLLPARSAMCVARLRSSLHPAGRSWWNECPAWPVRLGSLGQTRLHLA